MVTVVKASIAMGSRMQKQHVTQADVQPATRQPLGVETNLGNLQENMKFTEPSNRGNIQEGGPPMAGGPAMKL